MASSRILLSLSVAAPLASADIRDANCSEVRPDFLSYHAHAIYQQNDTESKAQASQYRAAFLTNFRTPDRAPLPACDPLDVMRVYSLAGPPGPDMAMCDLGFTNASAGPFLTGQFSFFISLNDFAATTAWLSEHRPSKVNVLIHPNTGCEINDHLRDALWIGKEQPLDAAHLPCNKPGCDGAMDADRHGFCNDGYGPCYPFKPAATMLV